MKLISFQNLIFAVLLMSGLSSCFPDPLEVDTVPDVDPEIVVATQMIPNQGLVVFLTKTFGAIQAGSDSDPQELLAQIAVNDAIVTIEGPHGLDTLLFLENGVYGGVFIPFQEGETYELFVESESMGQVCASATVQPQVKFNDIETFLSQNDLGDTLAQVMYSLQDPGEKNWYMVNVQQVAIEELVKNILSPNAQTLLYEDLDFEENFFSESFPVINKTFAPGDTISVSLSSISEAYYNFMKIRMDNRLNLIEFLSEPVNYPSNIEGGKGFFNLHVPDFRFFVFESFGQGMEASLPDEISR